MKGIVFTTFTQMVEEKFGLEVLQSLLDKTQLESGGAYTAGATYSDREIVALVTELSHLTNLEIPALIEAFGVYMFPVLASKYPTFLTPHQNLKDFLKSIDSVIHIEVRKLDNEVELPTIHYKDIDADHLTLLYQSPRKLCHLAIGLTKGAAQHFKREISVDHPVCMHNGEDHCELAVTFR